jgi:hypothetical protein
VQESDNISALPHRTPTAVLELMAGGMSPYEAVTGLIRSAMLVAEGFVPDVDDLRKQIDEADELADRYGSEDEDLAAVLMAIRLTPLDPMRPARDLLEDLLSGIEGCLEIYRETYYTSQGASPADADSVDREDDMVDDDNDDADDFFRAEVCERASEDRDRLI